MGESANGRMGESANGRRGEWATGRVDEWASGRIPSPSRLVAPSPIRRLAVSELGGRVAILTEEQRHRLSDEDFAVPGKRQLPLHDAEHARLAWDELDRTEGLTPYEREEARARIIRALHRHGVKFGRAMQESEQRTMAGAQEATVADEAGHVVEVTIARPGVSNNGYVYTPAVLADAAGLWNGAPAFLDHPTALDLTRAGSRSLRDLVGVYEGARYEEGRGLRARLRLSANDHGAFETIREAAAATAAGRPAPPIGISADWKLLKSAARGRAGDGANGRARWNVHSIVAVNSGDLVIRPSAGGSFDRILEADRPEPIDYSVVEVLEAVVTTGREGDGASGREGDGAGLAAAPARGLADSASAELQRAVDAAMRPVRLALAQATLDAKLGGSGLPAAAVEQVRSQFAGRVFEASEVDSAIAGMRTLLGAVFGQQSIRGVGAGVLDPGQPQGVTPLEKVQAAFDRLFGLDVAGHLTGVPRLTGIREAYVLVTGDKFFDGRYHWEESIVREANETTTAVMSNVVLNSMTKRLVKDYQAQPKWWEPFTIKVPVIDFKQQNRIRLNDFASLATVAEDGTYANVAWGDARENYTPTKFGNLVAVTLEMFLNDDLHAVQRIPTKLAHAAVVTINEQVGNLFTQSAGTGPTMADTFHVFDAANHQGNTSVATPGMDLSSAALQTAMTSLEKIQNSAGKRIGVRGRYLLVPPDLRWQAQVITQSQYLAGTANNDINPLAGAVIPIVVPQLTTAYQWYLLADPTQIEGIEIGFLNGREEPELLVQDNPAVGLVFTNDAISYKLRHIYGLGWLDYRGAFAALPTS